jgi:lipoprotein-anchoring transpeptidase ErfK/SrfK
LILKPSRTGRKDWGVNGLRLVSNGRQHHPAASNTSASNTSAAARKWAQRIALMAAVALFATPETASAQSFWNWGASDHIDAQPAPKPKRVKAKRKADPAEAIAKHAAKPQGPLVITVSIEKQRVKVYDSNGLFAEAAVSTGTRTHPTPTGVFSIIQKNKHHVSNLYNASMPYMQRITWSGVAMHTGPLPGYAASHGCIRLPNEFAARLWTWTKMGTRVIVAPGEVSPTDVTHPKLVAKMMPQANMSAAPAATPTVAAIDMTPAKSERAPVRRTADASEAIAGMKGTLSDASAAAPATDSETKTIETAAEPKTIASEAPVAAPSTAEVKIEAKTEAPVASAEAKPVDTDSRETAAKAQEPVDGDKAAEAKSVDTKPADTKPADTKAAETAASEAKPAETAQTTAQPASDIAKPAEIKPADIAAETAKPAEIAKPVELAKPIEAAKPSDIAAPSALPDAVKPIAVAKPRAQSHVAVFISRKDKKLYVRQGYEPLFDVPVEIADIDRPLGTHVFTARGDKDDSAALHWSVVSLPQVPRKADTRAARQGKAAPVTQSAAIPALNPSEALDRITIPADAMEKIAAIIAPGGSLLISDHGLGWETGRGTDFIVPLR